MRVRSSGWPPCCARAGGEWHPIGGWRELSAEEVVLGSGSASTDEGSPKLPPGSLRVYASGGTVAASVSEVGGALHGVVAL